MLSPPAWTNHYAERGARAEPRKNHSRTRETLVGAGKKADPKSLEYRFEWELSLRILRALGDIATTTHDKSFRASLVELGKRTVTGCTEKLGREELKEIHNRMASLEKFLEILPSRGSE